MNILIKTSYLVLATLFAASGPELQASDETISLDGQFGEFIRLGATADEVRALGPDRVEPSVAEEQRVASTWHYFDSRAIRVRVCDDDQRVGAVNAGAAPATRKYVTEAGARIGDNLERVRAVYGERLEAMPETEDTIWSVSEEESGNMLTFGFSTEGVMRWVALGATRENGWTCGAIKEM